MPRSSRKNFGENLRRLLDAPTCIVEIDDLAKACKVTPTTIYRWIKGTREPSFDDMDTIARKLEVPVKELFEDPTDDRTTGLKLETALRMVVAAVKPDA